jgi:NitT/TauT family transport system permease protein
MRLLTFQSSLPAEAASRPAVTLSVRARALWSLGGVALMLLAWQVLAAHTHAALVASPAATWDALRGLVASGELWAELAITLRRLLAALALSSALGFGLGVIAGFSLNARAFLEPVRWVIMTLPTIFIAVMGLLWFGMGSTQVIFLVTVIVTPVIYINTLYGFDTLDRQLIEMARLYRFSRRQMFTEIYLPGIGFSVITGLTLAAGIGVRAVVIAELLGAFDGVGHSFNRAWTFLNTPEMFAWIAASLALMAGLEFALLNPVRRALTRWKREPI